MPFLFFSGGLTTLIECVTLPSSVYTALLNVLVRSPVSKLSWLGAPAHKKQRPHQHRDCNSMCFSRLIGTACYCSILHVLCGLHFIMFLCLFRFFAVSSASEFFSSYTLSSLFFNSSCVVHCCLIGVVVLCMDLVAICTSASPFFCPSYCSYAHCFLVKAHDFFMASLSFFSASSRVFASFGKPSRAAILGIALSPVAHINATALQPLEM
ncbi:hypothetical protein TRVL_02635 [Trypanosoma vivax]|nr:hypothetical protein TRVL_02635 [Trypanosoma vivax]